MTEMEADERAEALLRIFLTPAQWDRYRKDGLVDVPGRSGTVIRIEVHRIRQRILVWRWYGPRRVAKYCVGARAGSESDNQLPLADRALTLLVWLTCDRRTFYRRARRFGKRLEFFRKNAENLNTTK